MFLVFTLFDSVEAPNDMELVYSDPINYYANATIRDSGVLIVFVGSTVRSSDFTHPVEDTS